MIAIIDYNMGNLRSVENAFEKLGVQTHIVNDPEKLSSYDKVILPGVGAFGDAMEHLEKSGMKEAIKTYATSGKPILGVCLGMQLLFESSQEFGNHPGLGLIEGEVKAFDTGRFSTPLKVPHMGWNDIVIKDSALFNGLPKSFYLYFVHSYHVVCPDTYIIGTTHYGYDFASAVEKENIYGFQPHPEKSHENGLKILQNFTEL
jgi:glutamine amidotransferase